MSFFAFPFVGMAFALPDVDGDGYSLGAPVYGDCDDGDANINPAAQDILGDHIDQDCDHHDALNRAFLEDRFSTPPWAVSGAAKTVDIGDKIEVGDGTNAGLAYRTLNFGQTRGAVWLVADVTHSGANCTATLGVGGVFGTGTISQSGTFTLTSSSFPGPPRIISGLTISCPAGGKVTLDWFSIQNSDAAVFPPMGDVFSVDWTDVNAAGGGGTYGAVWAYDGWLVAGGDAGGVGLRDTWATNPAWQRVDGVGIFGLQDTTAWDVAAVDWDGDPAGIPELFALTGEMAGYQLVGGFWMSDDAGEHWLELANSLDEGIGIANRWTECDDKSFNAGAYLLVDETPQQLWVASNYQYTDYTTRAPRGTYTTPQRDFGVHLWSQAEYNLGGSGFCSSPVPQGTGAGGLPSDQIIGAIALSRDTDSVRLVVGTRGSYQSGGLEVPSLYVCDVPSIPGTAGADAEADVDCLTIADIVCSPVPGSEGLDITDLEVSSTEKDRVFVAEGGIDPDDVSKADGDPICRGGPGRVWELEPSTLSMTDIGDPSWYDYRDFGVTGVSVDPSGTWLLAFLPGTDSTLADAPIYRLDVTDPTASWVQVLHDVHQSTHALHVDYSGGWWEASTMVQPWTEPEIYAPHMALDAAWFVDPDDVVHTVVMTPVDMWDVTGMDGTSGTIFPVWDGDLDTEWTSWPEPETGLNHDFESMGGSVALDLEGNLWVAARDKTAYLIPADTVTTSSGTPVRNPNPAERDCLFEGTGSGGSWASTSPYDGTVWMTLYDQVYSGETIPHRIGVWRTTDQGASWGFMGAGYDTASNFKTAGNQWVCRGGATSYTAVPFDYATAAVEKGVQFTDNPYNLPPYTNNGSELYYASWGNPVSVAAVTAEIAAVTFSTWSGSADAGGATVVYSDYPGRLTYTLDGGVSWLDAGFDPGDCQGAVDKADYFAQDPTVSLKDFQWEDRGEQGVFEPETDAWQMDLIIGAGNLEPECSIARVRINSSGATWHWYTLPDRSYPSYLTGCAVDAGNFLGVQASPWSEEAFVWGSYEWVSGTELGGVCALNLTLDTLSPIMNPNSSNNRFEVDIGDVEPNPAVANVLLIGTQMTIFDRTNCSKPYIDDMTASPPATYPTDICPYQAAAFMAVRQGGGWTLREVPGTPSSLVSSKVAWGGDSAYPETLPPASTFFYSTYGPGIWRASLEW